MRVKKSGLLRAGQGGKARSRIARARSKREPFLGFHILCAKRGWIIISAISWAFLQYLPSTCLDRSADVAVS